MSKKVLFISFFAALLVFSEIITPLVVSFWLDSALSKVMPARQLNF